MFVFPAAAAWAHVATAGFGFGLGVVVHGCAILCIGGLLREVHAVGFGHGSEQVGHAGRLLLFECGRGGDFLDCQGCFLRGHCDQSRVAMFVSSLSLVAFCHGSAADPTARNRRQHSACWVRCGMSQAPYIGWRGLRRGQAQAPAPRVWPFGLVGKLIKHAPPGNAGRGRSARTPATLRRYILLRRAC